jgi:hypothetical protein
MVQNNSFDTVHHENNKLKLNSTALVRERTIQTQNKISRKVGDTEINAENKLRNCLPLSGFAQKD